MNDTTKIVTDSLVAITEHAKHVVNNTPTSLGDMLQSIAPFLYFLGVVILIAAAYLIWGNKRK